MNARFAASLALLVTRLASAEPPIDAAPPAPGAAPEGDAREASMEPPRSDADDQAVEPSASPTSDDVDAKALYTLEEVEIRGNDRTLSRIIAALLPCAPGDRLDPTDHRLLRARYRLLATGYFRDVELSLRRGSRRGRVVLVVDVRERNTLVIESLVAGVGARDRAGGRATPIGPFGSVELLESNLGGTGLSFGAAAAGAYEQHAVRLRVGERGLLATGLDLGATFLTARHREAFGTHGVLVADGAAPLEAERAIYSYDRIGGSLTASHRLDADWTVHGSYRVERIDAPSGPRFASELVEGIRTPLALHLFDRPSSLGVVGAAAQYDSRDESAFPTRGILARFAADVAAAATGSDYPYAKLETQLTRWFPMPWRHDTVRFHAQASVVTGAAPLFERFYVGDLSDLLPDRVVGLTVDERAAPNLLGTRVRENRWGTVAAKLGGEYAFRVYRGGARVESVDIYLGAGAYYLDDPSQLLASARPRTDRSLPVDLTVDAGIRLVTTVGVFGFGLSNWLGLFPAEVRP